MICLPTSKKTAGSNQYPLALAAPFFFSNKRVTVSLSITLECVVPRQQAQATLLRNELAAVRQELISSRQEPTASPGGGGDIDQPEPTPAAAETLHEGATTPPTETTTILPSAINNDDDDDNNATWRRRYEQLSRLFANQTKELNEKVRTKKTGPSSIGVLIFSTGRVYAQASVFYSGWVRVTAVPLGKLGRNSLR